MSKDADEVQASQWQRVYNYNDRFIAQSCHGRFLPCFLAVLLNFLVRSLAQPPANVRGTADGMFVPYAVKSSNRHRFKAMEHG